MITKLDKNSVRQKRHARVRAKLSGTEARPRLNVYRSNKHIHCQIIDDVTANLTLIVLVTPLSTPYIYCFCI